MSPDLPRHVAFVMDGNGRWAAARGLPRAIGHRAGADTVRRVVSRTRALGIPFLTLYAFSTENWSRPPAEVEALMLLFGEYVRGELPSMLDNGVRLRILGDTEALPGPLREELAHACRVTVPGRNLTLCLAVNYGGRDEIVRAARRALGRLAAAGLPPDRLDAGRLAAELDSAGLPDPDLVVRTGGETRLSNFLIWQSAYAELIFTPRLWPDFSEADYGAALAEYAGRERRFGGLSS